jgi:hypothetical protein
MPDAQQRHLFEPEVIRGIVARLRVQWLLEHFDERKVWAAFMFVNGFITIGLLRWSRSAPERPSSSHRWGRPHSFSSSIRGHPARPRTTR